MQSNPSGIPFVIITFGYKYIENSIKSLLLSTKIPLRLFIVNNSGPNSDHAKLLKGIVRRYNLELIHAPNLWVLSLNHPTLQNIFNSNPYYFVSDDDITYPSPDTGDWVKDFIETMISNLHIGKLSLSLHWSDSSEIPNENIPFMMAPCNLTKKRKLLDNIYEFTGDTTPAIYRTRLFAPYTNFFSPRHQKLVRLDLYCGVSTKFHCTSLSNIESEYAYSSSYYSKKAICFALTSAYLSIDNLRKTPLFPKLFYLAFRPFVNSIWIIHLLLSHFLFILFSLNRRR